MFLLAHEFEHFQNSASKFAPGAAAGEQKMLSRGLIDNLISGITG